MTRRPFEDAVGDVVGATVLLDVDGTLLPDGTRILTDAVAAAVARLRGQNDVYLVSNHGDAERIRALAETLSVAVAPAGTPAGKPSARAADGIPREKPLVVIGEKGITDGLFARAIGARFVRVRPKWSGKEKLSVRVAYLIDAVVSSLLWLG